MTNDCLHFSLDPSQSCKIKNSIQTNKHKRILVDKGILLTPHTLLGEFSVSVVNNTVGLE